MQLINNIRRILKGEAAFDSLIKIKTVCIYPILVVHDETFNVPGLNRLLNDWFQKELSKLSDDSIDVSHVRELVIIPIDFIIYIQQTLRDKKITLEKLIEGYIRYVNIWGKKKEFKSEDELLDYRNREFEPFSAYAIREIQKNNLLMKPNEFFNKLRKILRDNENITKS